MSRVPTTPSPSPIQKVQQPTAGAGLLVSLGDVVAQEDDLCMSTFGIPAPCLIAEVPPELEAKWPGQYLVFRPIASVAGGWDLKRIDATVTGLTEAVLAYDKLVNEQVRMPRVLISLLNGEEALTTAVHYDDGT
jgi:hypothetical protein